MQGYAKVAPILPVAKNKMLLQAWVTIPVGKKFEALARAQGHKKAGYLRHLVELHVDAMAPKLLRALMKAQPARQSTKGGHCE